jgi:protease I
MDIACIVGEGFEEQELQVPLERLRQAGHDVTLIGRRSGERVKGKRGAQEVEIELGIDDARVEDFDALLIPGGYSPDHLRADERFVDLVAEFDETDKLIAAICHGPQILITADLVDGRRLTAWDTVQIDLEYAGADVVDEPVVVDGNWITSRKPADLDAFTSTLLKALDDEESDAALDDTEEEDEAPAPT